MLHLATAREEYFEEVAHAWLDVPALDYHTVHTKTECAIKCLKHAVCEAVSVGYLANHVYMQCQLLQPSSEDTPNLASRPHWTFLSIDLCMFTNCLNGATCRFTSVSSYICDCPSTHRGEYCEISCDISYGSSCFNFVTELLTWQNAVTNCANQGGRLAEVHNSVVNDQMKAVMNAREEHIWIGASEESAFNWIWVTSRATISWSDWAGNEPNNPVHENHCLHFWYPHNGWADSLCSSTFSSYCEYT